MTTQSKSKNVKIEYQNFIKLAETGYYPLFFKDWVSNSLQQSQSISITRASHNVKHVFNQLSRHHGVERKKTALLGMDRLSREEFIRSFLKVVEHKVLTESKILH